MTYDWRWCQLDQLNPYQLLDPRNDKLYILAMRFTHNRAEAEDLAQQTRIQMLANIKAFDSSRGTPVSWAFKVMLRLWLNATRKQVPTTVGFDESPFEPEDPQESGHKLSEQFVQRESLNDALGQLPGELRAALVLVYVEDLSYAEAAEAMGVPIGTIRSRIHRAKEILRERLGNINNL